MNGSHLFALLIAGLIVWQVITGKALHKGWGEFTSRQDEPVMYWLMIIGQCIILVFVLVKAGTMSPDLDARAVIVLATCGIVGVACLTFFNLNKRAALKYRVLRSISIAAGVLLVGLVWWTGHRDEMFFGAVLFAVFFNLVLYQTVWFCDACGRTGMHVNFWSRVQFCPKCCATLEK